MGLAIKNYTSQRLQFLQEKFSQLHLNSNEIQGIRDEITEKSDGMFLYARLVLNFLDNKIFYRGSEVKSSIKELLKELSDFYRKILTQILVHLDSQSTDRIKSIFCWIAFAKRPLKRIEFLSAISFSSGDPDIDHLVPAYILDMCGALIEERRDNTLAFIHMSVKEFLQSSSNSFSVNEGESISEHGKATITCLLSGFDVFVNPYQSDKKNLRVARGLHGFHIYSTEHWIEYILSQATCTSSQNASDMLNLANRLAEKLSNLRNSSMDMRNVPSLIIQDTRLAFLQNPLLRKEVEWTLWTRSLKGLEQTSGISGSHIPSSDCSPQGGISTMLASYEESVKFLLSQNDYPGVSAEEFGSFKSQFRGSIYTCRLASCPRAALGFESDSLRLDHEKTHLPRPQCSFPKCQYPPFVSAQALKTHVKKHHSLQTARTSIRQVSRNPIEITHRNTTTPERALTQLSVRQLCGPLDKADQHSNPNNPFRSNQHNEIRSELRRPDAPLMTNRDLPSPLKPPRPQIDLFDLDGRRVELEEHK